MKLVTFYFSGTGNTRWTVEEFSRLAREKGHETSVFSIEEKSIWDHTLIRNIIASADYVGFAYPVYGAALPPIMQSFWENLRVALNQEGFSPKPVYLIATMGFVNALGPFLPRKLLAGMGLRLAGAVNVCLANNITTPELKSVIPGPEIIAKRKTRARDILATLNMRLTSGRKYIRGIGPYLIPGIIIRRFFAGKIKEQYRSFSVKADTCTQCLLCVKNCPTGSITFSAGEFRFNPGCTACMRCYNFCPTYSILIQNQYADPRVYPRYRGPGSTKV